MNIVENIRDCDNCAFYDEGKDEQPCCYCHYGECFEPAEELEEESEAESDE